MADLLFYLFAGITLISAFAMVLLPNAVNGAMCMIVSFLGTAALFVLLEAYFLAILQVLVYAGYLEGQHVFGEKAVAKGFCGGRKGDPIRSA